MRRSPRLHRLTTLLLIALGSSSILPAQGTPTPERVRILQTEKQETLQQASYLDLPRSPDDPIDVGGWATLNFFDFRDDDHSASTPDQIEALFLQDYRLWLRGSWKQEWGYYLRLRHLDFRFAAAAGVPAPDTRRQEDPELDMAYLDYAPDPAVRMRLGRQFVRAGRGLVLASDLDAVDMTYQTDTWTQRFMVGRSLERDPNLDTSIVGFDRGTQERFFYLSLTDYRTEDGTRYYGYLLIQRDESQSLDPAQSFLDFHYDSEYVGIGAEGSFNPLLHYFLEVVQESGDVIADTPDRPRVAIDATGLTSGLLYYPEWKWKPLVSLEYAFGGGDRRRGSVTNVFGGKQNNSPDRNFLYFGTYDGGLALSPRLSNLHVLRAGLQVKPFPREGEDLPGLLVGSKVSFYWKDTKDGVISDPLAVLASKDVGTGLDLFTGYRPFSDTSLFVQYGRFWPGISYPITASDPSSRWLVTSTISF